MREGAGTGAYVQQHNWHRPITTLTLALQPYGKAMKALCKDLREIFGNEKHHMHQSTALLEGRVEGPMSFTALHIAYNSSRTVSIDSSQPFGFPQALPKSTGRTSLKMKSRRPR